MLTSCTRARAHGAVSPQQPRFAGPVAAPFSDGSMLSHLPSTATSKADVGRPNNFSQGNNAAPTTAHALKPLQCSCDNRAVCQLTLGHRTAVGSAPATQLRTPEWTPGVLVAAAAPVPSLCLQVLAPDPDCAPGSQVLAPDPDCVWLAGVMTLCLDTWTSTPRCLLAFGHAAAAHLATAHCRRRVERLLRSLRTLCANSSETPRWLRRTIGV
jgi:hypothetical protein